MTSVPDHAPRGPFRLLVTVSLGYLILCGILLPGATAEDSLWRQPRVENVRCEGEIGRRIQVTIENNILQIDVKRDFIEPFKKRNQKGGYVGLGKLLDSIIRFAVHTGDSRLIALKKSIIQELREIQEEDGYIGIMAPDARMWSLWDIHEMSYLIYALATDHKFFKDPDSLDAARRLADYLMRNWQTHPDNKPGGGSITVYMAVTGLENAFLLLLEETQDERYKQFVVDFRKLPDWDARIVVGRHGPIEGHIYAYLCRSIAQLRLDNQQFDPRLWRASRQALEFLLRQDGLVITGECGDHECWHDSQAGTINLGETCATAYLIRWLDELLRREKKSLYGDIMERAIYNGLFAAQSPDGRNIRYYTPFDGPRSYFPSDTYCCPNNYRRIVAELPGMIAYETERGVALNLYTQSEIKLRLPSGQMATIKQQTRYPHEGKILITVEVSQPEQFELRLRIPRYCQNATIEFADSSEPKNEKGGDWAVLHRTWKSGDQITLTLPMALRCVRGRKAQSGRVAIMYGPLVFCLSRQAHPELKDVDLRLLTINPETLEGPFPDEAVHPDGLACRVQAWAPGAWYPHAKPNYSLTLREFADPHGEMTYFHVPNPYDPVFVEDELISQEGERP